MFFGVTTGHWWADAFALIGAALWLAVIALAAAALIPERAAAGHRPGPRGWWARWKAHNERVVREREARRWLG